MLAPVADDGLAFATAGETQFGAKLTEPLAGFELSAAQEESLLERQVASHGSVFSVVSIAGRLEPAALREALDAVTARHEALRTTFHRRPGLRVPLQVIHDRLALGWREVDLRVPGQIPGRRNASPPRWPRRRRARWTRNKVRFSMRHCFASKTNATFSPCRSME